MVEVDRDYIFQTLDHESFLIDQVDDTKKKFVAEGLCFFVMRLICNSCLLMYFLILLLFTQPSAVNVTTAIYVDS